MKNIIRIISLIFVVTAIGGCGKSQQHQSFNILKTVKMENVRRHRLVDRHSGISRKKLHNCWFRMVTLQMNT